MSYNEITPSYYQLLQPGDPWHAGSTGWTRAPYPSWGNNPNLVGPARQGTNGLGVEGNGGRGVLLAGILLGAVGLLLAFGAAGSGKLRANGRRRYRSNRRWTTAYKNKLPDSAFLVVESGGEKERRGGETYTVPRSKRKLPYRNLQGAVDLPHLRNAIARAPLTDIPRDQAEQAQSKGRKILDDVHAGKIRKVARSR